MILLELNFFFQYKKLCSPRYVTASLKMGIDTFKLEFEEDFSNSLTVQLVVAWREYCGVWDK